MKLQLNGKLIDVDARTLSAVLDAQGYGGARVATAVNGTFVPAAARDNFDINDGDQIEVLAPMQGG